MYMSVLYMCMCMYVSIYAFCKPCSLQFVQM